MAREISDRMRADLEIKVMKLLQDFGYEEVLREIACHVVATKKISDDNEFYDWLADKLVTLINDPMMQI